MPGKYWKDKLDKEFAKWNKGPRGKSTYENDIMKIGAKMGIFTKPKSVKKNTGGKISKYYKGGGNVITGR
tara:strand:- start:5569 stop:5778 length:210 start_codon:yes stop_codon:yes gene_type:complete